MIFRRILIAVDGTEASTRAVQVGADLASASQAEIILVTAVSLPQYVVTAGGVDNASVENYVEKIARETLQSAVELLAREKLGAEIKVLVGPAAEAITLEVAASGADLVVMGRRGRREPKDLVLGSVSDQVGRSIAIPILLVP